MPESVISVNGVPIRLTDERWAQIVERHRAVEALRSDLLLAVERPFSVLAGYDDELLGVRRVGRFWIVVAYVESTESDGFIVTAFLSRADPMQGRTVVWPST